MSKQQESKDNHISQEFGQSLQALEVRAEVLSRPHINQETVKLRNLKRVCIASAFVAALTIGEGVIHQNGNQPTEASSLYNAWEKIRPSLMGISLLGALGACFAFAKKNKKHTNDVDLSVHHILNLTHVRERHMQ